MSKPDPAATSTPEPTGTPSGTTTPPEATTPSEPEAPFRVFKTQAEYEAAFGPTRTEGRKSLAKSLGFDSIEEFQNKWSGLTELEKQQMTATQKLEAERDRYKTESQARFDQVKQVKLGLALDELAGPAEANIKPERKDAFLALRDVADGEVDPQTGEVNKELLKHSILTAAQKYPEFVAKPTTVGNTTGVPANVAGAKITTEEQTSKHLSEGNMLDAIGSQLGKLFNKA